MSHKKWPIKAVVAFRVLITVGSVITGLSLGILLAKDLHPEQYPIAIGILGGIAGLLFLLFWRRRGQKNQALLAYQAGWALTAEEARILTRHGIFPSHLFACRDEIEVQKLLSRAGLSEFYYRVCAGLDRCQLRRGR